MRTRSSMQLVLAIAMALVLASSSSVFAQGFAPRGRTYTYGSLFDSTLVTHEFAMTFADSTLYSDVDSFVVRRDDAIRSAWSRSFQDSLVQWFRNSNPLDYKANQVQLLGFERPGLRVFYEPPLPWVPSLDQLSVGDSTWTWRGQVWPTSGTGLPDSLVFTAQIQEPVMLFDASTRLGWRIRVEGAPSIPLAPGVWIDLAGRRLPDGAAKAFAATTSWYGSYNDGEFHWLLLRDDSVALLPDLLVPIRSETMGSLRARFRAPPSAQ